ncbi:MAG: hypothetical protein ABH877_04790, partial [bacterium]
SVLLGKTDVPSWLVSRALWLHGLLAAAGVLLLAGHLGHVFLTRHGRDYLEAMVRGTLAERTARERHPKWWEDTVAPPETQDGDGSSEEAPSV